MSRVITLLNEKGGVGKTTLSVHIAAGLAIRGERVLLIDADAQAQSTYLMQIPEFGGLYRLLAQDAEWKAVLQKPDPACWAGDHHTEGELAVLPSNVETRAIPMVVDNPRLLRERLDEMISRFDRVVIDTAPTPSMLHAMIYLATDAILYPTQCEALSMDGLRKSTMRVGAQDDIRGGNGLPPLRIMAVQPTMVTATRAHRLGLKAIRKHFGEMVWAPIKKSTVWQDACHARKTLFAYAPDSRAAEQAWDLVERIVEHHAARL